MSKRTYQAKSSSLRENATIPSGKNTGAGKLKRRHEILEAGPIGGTVLLPTGDVATYESHLESVNHRYDPKTSQEGLHVQTIANIEWTLLRISTLERDLLARGRELFADCHAEESSDARALLIEAEVLIEFREPLAKLALQEDRLNRQHEHETDELKKLQIGRRTAERSTSARSRATLSLLRSKPRTLLIQ